MEHAVYEIRVYNLGEDDYVIAQTFDDSCEALKCLERTSELGLNVALGIYCWNE